MNPIINLKNKPTLFRSSVVRNGQPRIDRDGGYQSAGIIRGISVITTGEALGHDMWIDDTMLEQVADAINGEQQGVKSRFTHPSLSGDGLGKQVGRTMGAYVDGDQVIADLHFIPSAHDTPDGDLAGYLLQLAEDDPSSYGASIAFALQKSEMENFVALHSNEAGEFKSPDWRNTQNLPHARLAALHAVDAVDEPAANPRGLFHKQQSIVQEAEALACFAIGLTSEVPELAYFDSVNPERLKGFLPRFLAAHNLELREKMPETIDTTDSELTAVDAVEVATETEQEVVADDAAETSETATEPVQDEAAEPVQEPTLSADRADAARFYSAFGDKGAVWFAQGLTFEQAGEKELAELKAENAQLKQKLSVPKAEGELTPVSFSTHETNQKQGMIGNIKIAGASRN